MKIEERWVETPPLTFSSNLPDAQDIPGLLVLLLAPTGALVLMMVYDIYIYIYPPTFSDFEHLCLSILLQVSL